MPCVGHPHKVRVVESHVTSDLNPIRFRTDDKLTVGHHDQIWRGYIWGTDQAGHSGWVPEEYLQIEAAEGTALALRDYDSTELTVGRKEILDVLDEASGWYLCRTNAGTTGWVPKTSLEPVED